MASRSAIRNRSVIVTVPTPRGKVLVANQEVHGLHKRSGWTLLWAARRAGQQDWHEATTAEEAIRRATLLPPRKRAEWLRQAARLAQTQIDQGATHAASGPAGDDGAVAEAPSRADGSSA